MSRSSRPRMKKPTSEDHRGQGSRARPAASLGSSNRQRVSAHHGSQTSDRQKPITASRRPITASRQALTTSRRTLTGTSAAVKKSGDDARRSGGHARVGRADEPIVFRPRGSLRKKLTMTMLLVVSVSLIILGVIMATITNQALFNQTKHSGIQIAKVYSVLGQALNEYYDRAAKLANNDGANTFDQEDIQQDLKRYLEHSLEWGGETKWTVIDAVTYSASAASPINAIHVGGEMVENSDRFQGPQIIDVAGVGTINLSNMDDINYYELNRVGSDGVVPVYSFKVQLNTRSGSIDDNTSVRVDVRIDTVQRVAYHLYLTIAGVVILTAVVASFAANRVSRRVTRPLRQLVKDMRMVSKGQLNHRTKPMSDDEIGVLAVEFDHMTRNLEQAQSLVVEQEKQAYELSLAKEVQQQLLPATVPAVVGYVPSAFYKGAKEVSGDYFDFIPLGNDKWGFIVADVSGKGIPGSMVMAVTRTIVRLVAQEDPDQPAETLKQTNRLIAKQIKRGMFVTAMYAVLNARTGTVTIAGAGHNPMVIYRAATQSYELHAPKGIAIGFNEGPLFDKNIQQMQVTLNHGDTFVLYTDGFPEAMNEQDEEWGDDKFYQAVAKYGHHGSDKLIKALLKHVIKHRGKAPQSDDLTMIAVQRV